MEHDHMLPHTDSNSSSHHNTADGQRENLPANPNARPVAIHEPRPQEPSSPSFPPPSYSQASDTSALPLAASNLLSDSPTTAELAPIQPHAADRTPGSSTPLPSLSSLTGRQHHRFHSPPSLAPPLAPPQAVSPPAFPDRSSYSPPIPAVNHWPSLNPLTAYYSPSHTQPASDASHQMDLDANNSGSVSVTSPDRVYEGRASSINLDDPDVRMAAEALGDLRADFISSPPARHTSLPSDSSSNNHHGDHSEPLLSLLTTSHPLLATTIEGCTSAYNNSKIRSPTFKIGVEYFEGYLVPIVNKVGSVGRVTGVEGSVRWFLSGSARNRQRPESDLEAAQELPHKRRKVDNLHREMTIDGTTSKYGAESYMPSDERRTSMSTIDTLPPYDDLRSPAYVEIADGQTQISSNPDPNASLAWKHRLIMSTSGLSVAMREESLRSLKYCLHWLRWANEHMANVVDALKIAVDQYGEAAEEGGPSAKPPPLSGEDQPMSNAPPLAPSPVLDTGNAQRDRSELAARIDALKTDVLNTLRRVIDTVSTYAGGSLPENATALVRRHLISLPQRFWVATRQNTAIQPEGDSPQKVREGAQKILVLAKEGLDMMSQVSGVLDGTIVSAEEWCERLRKKKGEDGGEKKLDELSATARESSFQLAATDGGLHSEKATG